MSDNTESHYKLRHQVILFSACNLNLNALVMYIARLFSVFTLSEFKSSMNLYMLGFLG